jgi:hypothetical protein
LDATFTPSVERSERAGVLFHSFRKRQFFGTFSGTIRQENGSLLEFSGLSGMAERIKIRR